jgi:D-serine deaminase-like pyridoxal phosphate-dependent protein
LREKNDIRGMKDIFIDRTAWSWIDQPSLMVHRPTVKENIRWMVRKAAQLGVTLRPHFKTHQSREIGAWFRASGVDRITVSSIEMARYFAEDGWTDITIALPINVRAIAEINALAKQLRLGVLISDRSAVPLLAAGLEADVQAWVEIDTGDGRSGIGWDWTEEIAATAAAIDAAPRLSFAGLLGHAGYTYRSHGQAAVHVAHDRDIAQLRHAAAQLRASRAGGFLVSTGDTPGCSLGADFAGADEIRPGNFVFYDVQQQQIGSCDFKQIGVAMAAPVIAVYPQRSEVIVHAGGVHLSKDFLPDPVHGNIYGRIALPTQLGWSAPLEGCYLRSISQEHGIAVVSPSLLAQVRVGDLLAVLPVHSCMTADLMGALYPVDLGAAVSPILMLKGERTFRG